MCRHNEIYGKDRPRSTSFYNEEKGCGLKDVTGLALDKKDFVYNPALQATVAQFSYGSFIPAQFTTSTIATRGFISGGPRNT